MKKYFLSATTIILLVLVNSLLYAQGGISTHKISYSYDAAGNRIKREKGSTLPGLGEKKGAIPKDTVGSMLVSVFPNPTLGHLSVNMDQNTSIQDLANILLFDYTGRLIMQKQQVAGSTDLDLTTWPAGIYTLKISSGGKNSQWEIVKE